MRKEKTRVRPRQDSSPGHVSHTGLEGGVVEEQRITLLHLTPVRMGTTQAIATIKVGNILIDRLKIKVSSEGVKLSLPGEKSCGAIFKIIQFSSEDWDEIQSLVLGEWKKTRRNNDH